MVKKGIAILLFLLVSAGFLYGFISYNRRLSRMMNQKIEQAEASLEPGEEPDETPETPAHEEPETVIGTEPSEEPEEAGKLISIPNVVGLKEDDAVNALKEQGLVPEIHLEYIDGVEKGYVFYQRPPKNNEVPVGTVVSFSVSRGPYGSSETTAKVKVPDLKGKTEAQAKVILSGLKLKMKSVGVYSDTVNSGQIISQDIPSGREVEAESTVSVNVSLGRELVDVPNVMNKSEADARALIEARGLKISARSEYSEKTQGTVISQSPASGQTAKGTTISITLSRGPQPVTPVPDPVEPEPEEPEDPGETEPDPIEEPEETPIG